MLQKIGRQQRKAQAQLVQYAQFVANGLRHEHHLYGPLTSAATMITEMLLDQRAKVSKYIKAELV